MKYIIGLVLLFVSIYLMIDLALKTRYTRKRLTEKKGEKVNPNF